MKFNYIKIFKIYPLFLSFYFYFFFFFQFLLSSFVTLVIIFIIYSLLFNFFFLSLFFPTTKNRVHHYNCSLKCEARSIAWGGRIEININEHYWVWDNVIIHPWLLTILHLSPWDHHTCRKTFLPLFPQHHHHGLRCMQPSPHSWCC